MSRRRGVVVLLAVVCAVVVPGARAGAAIRARPDATPITDGTVEAVARSADRIYVGGNFTRVLPRIGPFAMLSPAADRPTGNAPEVSGGKAEVDCAVSDGSGGFYVGGSFTHVAGVVRRNAAHILADGTLDPNWNPDVADEVLAIARLGSTVYLGGEFHGAGAINGNVPRNYLAAVDAGTGRATGWAPQPDNYVVTLAAAGSSVYFGGAFDAVDGTTRHRAAAADATSGALTGWNPEAEGGSVIVITIAGSDVWLGGSFFALAGTKTGPLAPTNATTGALRTPWGGLLGAGKVVSGIAVSGSTVYFGGEFTSVLTGEGPKTRNHAAAVNQFGLLLPWDPNVLGGKVNSLAVSGSSVYLAGDFSGPTSLNGSTERNYLAAVDSTSGAVTGWNPNPTGAVKTLAVSGGSIGVGGAFTSLGPGVPRRNLAAFSAADGSLLPWAPEPDGGVRAILPDGGRVFVGGLFGVIGARSRSGLAAIDSETGVATGWAPQVGLGSGVGTVEAMQLVGPTLFIGGTFDNVNGGLVRKGAAAVDATTGIVTPFNPNVNGAVDQLFVSGPTAYLSGPFLSSVGGTPREGVAATDAGSGALLPWDPKLDGRVSAMAGSGSTIYLAGGFTSVNGVPRPGSAAVDATSAAPTNWSLDLPSFATVRALAVSGSTIYAGGVGFGLAAFDRATGAPAGWSPGPVGGEVLSLATDPAGGVVAGGSFRSFDESPQADVASFSAPPESIAAPVVSGTPAVGGTLSCSEGTWAGSVPQSRAFSWFRDGAPIGGANGARYSPTGSDGGRQLGCRVTSTNLAGSAGAGSDAVTVTVAVPRPRTKPVLSGLRIVPSSFAAAKRGGSIVAKRYAKVGYRLSAAAKVTFTVQRAASGRRRGRSCVKPTAKLRKAKKCRRYVKVRGSFSRSRPGAGRDRFHFSGRIGGRALRPGAYRLIATAADTAGARSQPARRAFHITEPKRRSKAQSARR